MTQSTHSTSRSGPLGIVASVIRWLTSRDTLNLADERRPDPDDVPFLRWLTARDDLAAHESPRDPDQVSPLRWLVSGSDGAETRSHLDRETP